MAKDSKLRKFLSIAILLASIALFSVYLFRNYEDFKPLLDVNPLYIALLVLANIASLLINGIFIKIVLVPFNKFISVTESFYVSLISSVGNYFAFVGAGLGFRAIYLKKRHNLSYGNFIATVAGNYVLVFFVTSVTGLIAMLLMSSKTSYAYWVLVFVFATLFVIDLMIMSVKLAKWFVGLLKKLKFNSAITGVIMKIIEGWILIINDKRLIKRLLLLTAAGYSLSLLTIYLILGSLNLHVAFSGLMLLAALSSLSVFINITPGNIGIKEAVLIFSGQAIGLSTPEILTYSVVDRAVLFLVLFAGWIFVHTKRNFVSKIVDVKDSDIA